MDDTKSFRLFVFFAILGIMYLAETIYPVRSWETQRWKRWTFHGTVTVVNTILTRLVVIAPVFLWLEYVRDQGWGLSRFLGLTGISEIIATVIVFDMLDYWWHRFNHVVPFLWRFHKVHHIDTALDVTTSLRFHPGELFLSYLAKSTWILIWGPSLWAFVIFESAVTAYSQFHHSNIDFPNKWEKRIRKIHMTPRLHTSHHTVTSRTRNANYSTIFLIWDRLFRTLREPDRQETKVLGLQEGRMTAMQPKCFILAPFIPSPSSK